jgi:hypothetical protein
MARVLIGMAALIAATTPAAPAAAQRCDEAADWVRACGSDEVEVTLVRCLPGGLVVSARSADTSLEVEIARDRPDAFRQVGGFGVSPIAEYADWSDAPEPVQLAFETVTGCLEDGPSLAVPEGRLVPGGRGSTPVEPPFPWLLFSALLLSLAALALHLFRTRPSLRAVAVAAGPPVLLAVVAFVARSLMTEPSFVHQNGQGPLWVSHALCVTPVYGPGYFEIFGWAVRVIGGELSAAVFLVQALLGAIAAGAVWGIARGAFVDRPLAFVLALAVAVEPALARIGQSESYFGAISSLLLIAGAMLSVGARRRRARDPVFLLCAIAAGLLVAQAARTHPVAWVPSATLPLVVVVGRGRLRSRLIDAAVAAVVIGAAAAILAVGTISDVTSGGVGEAWLPDFFERIPRGRLNTALVFGAIAAVAIAFGARDRRRGLLRAALLFVVVAVAFGTHVIGAVGPIIVTGYVLLFLPAVVAILGTSVAGASTWRRSPRLTAVALLGVLLAYGAGRSDALLELPTDAREQAWLLAQRAELPDDATVSFLGSAGPRRRLHLPFYGECGGVDGPVAVPLSETTTERTLDGFWYRSSLCTTDDGRAFCDSVERRHRMRPLSGTDLPAIESMEGLGYDDGTVHVGLYAIEGPR